MFLFNMYAIKMDALAKWTVLFASHPMILGDTNQDISVIISAQNLQSKDSKFLRIPVKLGKLNFPLGCQLQLTDYSAEKYSPTINTIIQSGLISSNLRRSTIIDVLDFKVVDKKHQNINDVFDVSDLDDIPIGNLVNIEGTIGKL